MLWKDLGQAYKDKEIFCKQRSKILWLKKVIRTFPFFHMTTIQWRRRNAITRFQTINERWMPNQVGIISIVEKFYDCLFISSRPTNFEEIITYVPASLNESMNRRLIWEVSDAEIKKVVFIMHPLKTSEIDGMIPLFLKIYCHIINKDICEAVSFRRKC